MGEAALPSEAAAAVVLLLPQAAAPRFAAVPLWMVVVSPVASPRLAAALS